MVRIRLRREGKKKNPIYKIVAADKRSPRNGGYLEALGQYDPNQNPISLTLKDDQNRILAEERRTAVRYCSFASAADGILAALDSCPSGKR